MICCHCLFENDETAELEKINKKLLTAIQGIAFEGKNRNKIPKEINADSIIKLLEPEKYFFKK